MARVGATHAGLEVFHAKLVAAVIGAFFFADLAPSAVVVKSVLGLDQRADPGQAKSLVVLPGAFVDLVLDAVIARAVGQIERFAEPRRKPNFAPTALDFPELAFAADGLCGHDARAVPSATAIHIDRQPGCRGLDGDVAVPGFFDVPLLAWRVVTRSLHHGALVLPIQVEHLAAGHVRNLVATGA